MVKSQILKFRNLLKSQQGEVPERLNGLVLKTEFGHTGLFNLVRISGKKQPFFSISY